MTENKAANNNKAKFVLIGVGLVVFAAWKFTTYFLIGLALIVAILVLAYFKVPRFHDFIHEKLHLKKKPEGLPTAQVRQGNGTPTAQMRFMCPLPGCGGILEVVQNIDGKYGLCNTCGKVQRIIK
jgi:hypothetical protein